MLTSISLYFLICRNELCLLVSSTVWSDSLARTLSLTHVKQTAAGNKTRRRSSATNRVAGLGCAAYSDRSSGHFRHLALFWDTKDDLLTAPVGGGLLQKSVAIQRLRSLCDEAESGDCVADITLSVVVRKSPPKNSQEVSATLDRVCMPSRTSTSRTYRMRRPQSWRRDMKTHLPKVIM